MITNGFIQSTIDRAQFPIQNNPNDMPTIKTMEVFEINFTPIDVRKPSKRELSQNRVTINASNEFIMNGKIYHVDEDKPISDLLSLLRIFNNTAAKQASKTEARLGDLESSVSELTLTTNQRINSDQDSHAETRFNLEARISKFEESYRNDFRDMEYELSKYKRAFEQILKGYRCDYDNVICRLQATIEENKDLRKNIGGLQKQINTLKSSQDSVKIEIGEVTSKAESLLRLSESKIEQLNLLHEIGDNKISDIEREVRSLDQQLVQHTVSNNTVLNPTQGAHPVKSNKNTGATTNLLAFKFKVDSSLKIDDLLARRNELKTAVPIKSEKIAQGKKFTTYFVEFKDNTSGKFALTDIRKHITNFDWKSTSDCPTNVKPWYGQAPSLTTSNTTYGDNNLTLEKKNSSRDPIDYMYEGPNEDDIYCTSEVDNVSDRSITPKEQYRNGD